MDSNLSDAWFEACFELWNMVDEEVRPELTVYDGLKWLYANWTPKNNLGGLPMLSRSIIKT